MRPNVRKFDTLDDALRWVEDHILAENGFHNRQQKPLPADQIDTLKDLKNEPGFGAFTDLLEERSYTAGQTIFTAGDLGNELFFIRQGIVRIVLPLEGGNYHNLASFGRGDFFGELAFFDGGNRSAKAVATEETHVYVITRDHLDEVVKARPAIGTKILSRVVRALAMRLRRADSELHNLHEP